MTLCVVLVFLAAACGVDTATTDTSSSAVRIDPTRDDVEPSYVNGVLCKLVFQGALTPQTQNYLIWPVGTNGIVNTTYNTPKRPNIYAIFGTGRPAFETHHVAGFDQFDHYHIAENKGGGTDVGNKDWDLLVLFPGPNFPTDPATYVSAKTPTQLFAQSAAGVLSPVLALPDAGFPPVVLHIPINCPEDDEQLVP
jgi:hypothetical protein